MESKSIDFNLKDFKDNVQILLKDHLYKNYTLDRVYSVGYDIRDNPLYVFFSSENISFEIFMNHIYALSMKLRHFYSENSSSSIDKIPNFIKEKSKELSEDVKIRFRELRKDKRVFFNRKASTIDLDKSSKYEYIIPLYNGLSYKKMLDLFFNGILFHNDKEKKKYLKKEIEIAGNDYEVPRFIEFNAVLEGYANLVIKHYKMLLEFRYISECNQE